MNYFKTITAGDGGLVATDDEALYEKAFGAHDQGHKPLRSGVEVGQRSILGLNFRATELIGAVARVQLSKIDDIVSTLRRKKSLLKSLIGELPGMQFRKLNAPEGDCATICTVIFDNAGHAAEVARKLNTKTVDHSGWHVYSNMEHINRHLEALGQPHGKGAYPRTDEILSRAINISVGVVDGGLGTAFGININSTDAEIEKVAKQFLAAYNEVCTPYGRLIPKPKMIERKKSGTLDKSVT